LQQKGFGRFQMQMITRGIRHVFDSEIKFNTKKLYNVCPEKVSR